ncbi:glycosyltransferase family 4 protein [Patescibacteria group bacterium]|nr:glycosyltransferase family 4 protein [Patescibacteria group bacterium]
MKIGIVLISGGWGGAERVVHYIVNSLKDSRNEVSLILNSEIIKYFLDIKKIKILDVGKFSMKNNYITQKELLFISKNLKRLLDNNNFDLINTHMISPLRFYRIFNSKKIPFIITFHGTDIVHFINPPNFGYKFFMSSRVKKSLINSSKLISVSHHQIKNFPEKYKRKMIVIPNGVDSKTFKSLKKIKQKKNVILFTGRFIDIKGVREIINVAKQLPQYEFWFAGQGHLENLINLPNTKNLGFQSTEELVKLYNKATICIFPSHREGLPLCGLEAMSCGRAVIATPLGFSEYIEDKKDGIIIPAKDENALKNAIVDLMTNEKKRKMIEKNARKKALKYSWDKVAKKYLKVFQTII